MPNPNKKSDFKKLKDLWYKKLKDTGFEDAESDENNLKVWSASLFGSKKALVQNGGWEAKYTYYRLAELFLNNYKFENNTDKIIWMYHCEGISVRGIVRILNALRKKKTYKEKVWGTIHRLEELMKETYLVGYKKQGN